MRPQRRKSVRSGTIRRRGAVAVQVALLMAVLIGFAALAFDVGAIHNTRADLQRAADAAALAAAARLADYSQGDPIPAARALAHEYVGRNPALGRNLLLASSDITFGRAVYDADNHTYQFDPTEIFPDSAQVRVRMTSDSPNGAMPLYFARIFGKNTTEISAEAIAMMVPRDIAIVADLSASHNDDSEFPNDIHPVWDDLSKSGPSLWGADEEDGGIWGPEYECADGDAECAYQRGGPAWGLMKELEWGDEIVEGYSQSSDSGLVYLPKNQNWSNSLVSSFLTSQGYATAERSYIMRGSYDGYGAHTYRTAVALGLAQWNSGIPGGLWQQQGMDPGEAGDGDQRVEANELTWLVPFGDRSIGDSADIWINWINTNPSFGRRYGLKSFVHYLLNQRPTHAETPELSNTPAQPMQAVKDAVSHLVTVVTDLETNDQMSLEVYGETARHEVNLTHDYAQVSDRLNAMQAGHYDLWTNMGGGITRGIEELTSERARPTARKLMFLLTDGQANVTEDGHVGDYEGGKQYALQKAQEAADQGIMIFAVSVGYDADTDVMGQIADIGGGAHFHASGSIEEYADQLEQIFAQLGGTRPVELIK
jgi:Flp pilus assembly protein TadG